MEENGVCRGMGSFGLALKTERKIEVPAKRCRSGLHQISGANIVRQSDGSIACRACKHIRRQREYWAKELAKHWEAAQLCSP
jgi:hypothetical protein